MSSKKLSHYDKESIPNAEGLRFAIVVSEWNENITENLYQGAHQVLLENGVLPEDILRMNVPGSFELTFGASLITNTTDVDAIITLGSVVKGETKHFDFICQGISNGISQLNISSDIPVIFGLLTDDNMQQAIDRSGGKLGNKGCECAIAAIKMASMNQILKADE
jgi:6,7-dimethyl-8-ribityllumazine synthase